MSDTDAQLFLSDFDLVKFKKGDFLQEEGDKCNIVRILLSGCARGCIVVDGKEITTNFYFEHDHSYDYVSYLLQQRSQISIQALDPIEAIELSMEAGDFLNTEVLGFHRMGFQMFKMNYIKAEQERKAFILKTPKERYLDLLENNKQVIARAPQHQLASYIGISAEHLSRIRSEIRNS